MGLVTGYDDALAHFTGGHDRATQTFRAWHEDPSKRDVVPHVEKTVTSVLYGLNTDDLTAVAERTIHPLGDISKSVRDRVPTIRDWHPAFSFQHALHHSLEASGEVLTYQAFREFCRDDPEAHAMLFAPATHALAIARSEDGVPFGEARDALRWRIGLAYYSFLRELFVIAALREAAIDARFHVLADCLFRVDFWIGDNCFELFITSPAFKYRQGGRKHGPAYYVGPSSRLKFHRLELPVQHSFGNVHVPDAAETVTNVRRAVAVVRRE